MSAEACRHVESPAVATAVRHALGWLAAGNGIGLYLATLLVHPQLQAGALTYGRWVPVHLNVQLYGWTALPLVAWLLAIYEVDRSSVRAWGPAVVWAWTAALVVGAGRWLAGETSGKIFLDWSGGALWGFLAALTCLWGVLALARNDRAAQWSRARRRMTWMGLAALAVVPTSILITASPAVYPPIDRTTGGPTGSSLLGSALLVVGLMLMLPRVAAVRRAGGGGRGVWGYFVFSWLVFGVVESMGGTHFSLHQIFSLWLLLPWIGWLPRDWAGFDWPSGSGAWRWGALCWWGLLVASGCLLYLPGVLDRLKFTQGLVAHSHLAMAGFTTSYGALVVVVLTGRRVGGAASVVLWHAAALVMVVVLAWLGWREGADASWMTTQPAWREWGLMIRAACGGIMCGVAISWWWERIRS